LRITIFPPFRFVRRVPPPLPMSDFFAPFIRRVPSSENCSVPLPVASRVLIAPFYQVDQSPLAPPSLSVDEPFPIVSRARFNSRCSLDNLPFCVVIGDPRPGEPFHSFLLVFNVVCLGSRPPPADCTAGPTSPGDTTVPRQDTPRSLYPYSVFPLIAWPHYAAVALCDW